MPLRGEEISKYGLLCAQVQTFNPEAARLLEEEMWKLPDIRFKFRDNVDNSFNWELSPQGHAFWSEVNHTHQAAFPRRGEF